MKGKMTGFFLFRPVHLFTRLRCTFLSFLLLVAIHLKTIELFIVLGQFALPTLECLHFHTENTSTFTQHVLQSNCTILF